MKNKIFNMCCFGILVFLSLISCDQKDENRLDNLTANSRQEFKQWAISNDGNFDINLTEFEAWGEDKFACEKGVDIGWTNKFSEARQERDCLIAVIDSNFDVRHEAISKSIHENLDEIPSDGIDNDGNEYVDDFNGFNFLTNSGKLSGKNNAHGTGILGAIAGNDDVIRSPLLGTNIKLLPIVALDEEKGAKFEPIIKAIKYAERMGAKICNLSVESYVDDKELRRTIENSDMLFCVSAGNEGENLDKPEMNVYPACYDFANVVSVADLRCDGNLSRSSNFGNDKTDMAAPGTDILTAYPNGKYEYWSGTSIATPYASAVASLIYSYSDETLSAPEIKKVLLQCVKKLKDLDGKTKTGGAVSMENAFDALGD